MKPSTLIPIVAVFLAPILAPTGVPAGDTAPSTTWPAATAAQRQLLIPLQHLPLRFEANKGQFDPRVRFVSRGGGYTLFLTSTEAVLALSHRSPTAEHRGEAAEHISLQVTATPLGDLSKLRSRESEVTVLRMTPVWGNHNAQVAGLDQLPGRSNYLIGRDPSGWRTNLPNYARVRYLEIYPGIHLDFYGAAQRELEYDFIVTPGADPEAITLRLDGPDRLEINAQGNLVLHLADGEVFFPKPYIYQEEGGARRAIAGGYVLLGRNRFGFQVAPYDASKVLVIDPTVHLTYSTYLGGAGNDDGRAVAVDAEGNVYVAGATPSTDFPVTPGSFQPVYGGGDEDVYVVKIDPTGSSLLYSTYLGGSDRDFVGLGQGLAVDPEGSVYLAGTTLSPDFPTTAGAFQEVFPGAINSGFVAKLNPGGDALVYSTHLGGDDPGLCRRAGGRL